jgi:hypothetical protein
MADTVTIEREPGFSRSEALELARRLEQGTDIDWNNFNCGNIDCEAVVVRQGDFSPRQRATIVAALRAYAK